MYQQTPVPCQGNEPYIFVSYSHRDKDIVYSLISGMIGKGLRVWFDEGIDPGTEWDDNIAAHVLGCDSMVAFVSANYLNSDNCRDELNYARDLKKDRLLVYLEPVELPAGMAMRMNRIQAINRYNYDRPEDFWNKFMCCQFIARSMAAERPEEEGAGKPAEMEPGALVELGKKYLFGRDVGKDYKEAVRLFRLAADRNDPEAMYNLGRCYATGRGVPQDYPEAVKWHLKAAELNQVDSQRALGHIYLAGRPGVPKNPAEGARWYYQAAMQGDNLSRNSLGECYENAWGVSQNDSEAFTWYLKASENGLGCDMARYHLGRLYLTGKGVEKDCTEAIRYFREAGGNLDAVNALGTCYENGVGVSRSPADAVELYLKAAAQGHVPAQVNLANCYMNGIGVAKDDSEAFEWYRKAAENKIAFDYNGPLWYVDQKAAEQAQTEAQAKLAEYRRSGTRS